MEINQTKSLSIASFGSEKCSYPHTCEGYRNIYILHLCIDGKGYYEVEGKKYEITAGQSFIIYPGVKMKYYPDKDNPWTYVWIDFFGSGCSTLLENTAFSDGLFVTPPLNLDVIYPLFKKGKEDYASLNAHKTKADFFNVLAFYIENFPSKKSEGEYNNFTLIKNFIDSNYFLTDMSVDYIAKKLRLHRTQIYRIVKQNTSLSVKELLDNKRIEEAKSLLVRQNISIKEIAYLVGYANPYHFSNAFKKRVGVSPRQYQIDKKFYREDIK